MLRYPRISYISEKALVQRLIGKRNKTGMQICNHDHIEIV
jgi:hypothetical protein